MLQSITEFNRRWTQMHADEEDILTRSKICGNGEIPHLLFGRSSYVVQPFRASCPRSEDALKGWTTYEEAHLAVLESATVSPQILMRVSIRP